MNNMVSSNKTYVPHNMYESGYREENVPYNINNESTKDNFNKFGLDLDDIIGLPPAAYRDLQGASVSYLNRVLASSLMVEIKPALPKPVERTEGGDNTGFRLYDLDYSSGEETYYNLLKNCGIEKKPILPLRVVGQLDGSITESWSNSYTESMFEQLSTSLPVNFLREIKMVTGKETLSEMIKHAKTYFDSGKNEASTGALQKFLSGINKVTGISLDILSNGVDALESYMTGTRTGGIIKNVLMGSGLDFPMIWQGSSYTPSYGIRVRLSCPDPTNSQQYEKYVVQNMMKLLSLGIPTSDGMHTYTQPLICTVNCPGLFKINAGYIANVDVLKGSESVDISNHQRPGTVDVTIMFGELYSTMIGYKYADKQDSDPMRPSIDRYANNLRSMAVAPNPYVVNMGGKELGSDTSGYPTTLSNLLDRYLDGFEINPPNTGTQYSIPTKTEPTLGDIDSYNSLIETSTTIDDMDNQNISIPQDNVYKSWDSGAGVGMPY
jgi:hypothetical protein